MIDLGGNTLTLSSSGLLMYGSGNYTIQDGQLGASGAGVVVNQIGSGTLTISSQISGGAGTFSVGGGGSVVLTGNSAYSGTTYIGNGLLNISNATGIPTGPLAFNGNGTLQAGANALNNNISIANAATATFDTQTFSTTANGLISGPGGLVKVGAGTLVLGNLASTYTGGTTINGGVLSCGSLSQTGYPIGTASSLGEGMSITFNGGTLLYTGTNTGGIDSGAAYGGGNDYLFTLLSGGGTIECPNGAITFSGVLAGSGNLTIANPSNSSLNLANAVYFGSNYRNASAGFSGNIIISNYGVLQVRNNTANLLGNAASVIIGPNGVLTADADSTIIADGDVPVQCVTPTVLNGGTLATQTPTMTYYGPVTVNPGTINYVGTINSETGAVTLAGNLQGSGTLVTTGTGGATSTNGVTLSGLNNSFSGAFESAFGYTAFTNPNAGSPNATWIASGQGYLAEMSTASYTTTPTVSLGTLSGTTGTLGNTVAGSTVTFSIGGLNTNTTFGGVLQNGSAGTVALLKVGTGSLALTGPNTYGGATTVSGGTLSISNWAPARWEPSTWVIRLPVPRPWPSRAVPSIWPETRSR